MSFSYSVAHVDQIQTIQRGYTGRYLLFPEPICGVVSIGADHSQGHFSRALRSIHGNIVGVKPEQSAQYRKRLDPEWKHVLDELIPPKRLKPRRRKLKALST